MAWARSGSPFTRAFEDTVAVLAQKLNHTEVARLMGVSGVTVGSIAERIVAEKLDPTRFDGLRRIGVDEISYRRHHRYLTAVVDHDRGRVIWVGVGKSTVTLRAFFRELRPERSALLELVSLDMSQHGGASRSESWYEETQSQRTDTREVSIPEPPRLVVSP